MFSASSASPSHYLSALRSVVARYAAIVASQREALDAQWRELSLVSRFLSGRDVCFSASAGLIHFPLDQSDGGADSLPTEPPDDSISPSLRISSVRLFSFPLCSPLFSSRFPLYFLSFVLTNPAPIPQHQLFSRVSLPNSPDAMFSTTQNAIARLDPGESVQLTVEMEFFSLPNAEPCGQAALPAVLTSTDSKHIGLLDIISSNAGDSSPSSPLASIEFSFSSSEVFPISPESLQSAARQTLAAVASQTSLTSAAPDYPIPSPGYSVRYFLLSRSPSDGGAINWPTLKGILKRWLGLVQLNTQNATEQESERQQQPNAPNITSNSSLSNSDLFSSNPLKMHFSSIGPEFPFLELSIHRESHEIWSFYLFSPSIAQLRSAFSRFSSGIRTEFAQRLEIIPDIANSHGFQCLKRLLKALKEEIQIKISMATAAANGSNHPPVAAGPAVGNLTGVGNAVPMKQSVSTNGAANGKDEERERLMKAMRKTDEAFKALELWN